MKTAVVGYWKFETLVVVTGGRDWSGQECRDIMERQLMQFAPNATVLLHGDQRGADLMADELSRELGWLASVAVPYLEELVNHKFFNKGGPARNQVVANIANATKERTGCRIVLCAFPMPDSTGTWDCVNRVKPIADRVIVARDMLSSRR